MFMEAIAESWKFDLEKEVLRQKGELNAFNDKRIDEESRHVKTKVSNLWKIMCTIRLGIKEKYELSLQYREEMDRLCSQNFETWVNFFGWTDDPRLIEIFGLQSITPFILTQQQSNAINKIQECIRSRRNVLIQKSRSEGITELLIHYDVWCWLYKKGFKGGWGSRKQDLVDKRGSPGSIFSRLRRVVYKLPPSMKPKGFDKERNPYDKILSMYNPDMGSYLIGEGGDNIGRGDRCSTYKVDEKAFVENQASVDEALSQNCDCQIDISTPNGQNHFYDKAVSGKVEVITLWWYRNPSKNVDWRNKKRPNRGECAWYEYQLMTRDSALVAKEIDIDYLASISGSMIKPEWVRSAVDLKIHATTQNIGGLDIAAGGKDNTVYISRSGPVASKPQVIPFSSPSKSAWAASELGKEDRISTLVYDQNTIGEDVYTILKEGERKVEFDLIGVHGQGKASDRLYDSEGLRGYEKFRNLRAEIWWSLRKRFEKTHLHVTGEAVYPEDELISIPSDDDELITQLSAPLLIFTPNGKIGVESKKEMASRGIKSPDKADALSYCYYPMENRGAVIPSFKNTNSENYKNFVLDSRAPIDMYVSIYHTEEMKVYMNVCALDYNSRKLLVMAEYFYDFFNPYEIARNALDSAGRHPIVKWIGNEEIFSGIEKGKLTVWHEYRKNKIKLTRNYRSDIKSSIDTIDKMFRDEYLCLHDRCELTMQHIRNWKNKGGQPGNNLYFALCLSQIITTLRKKKIIYQGKEDEYYGYNII